MFMPQEHSKRATARPKKTEKKKITLQLPFEEKRNRPQGVCILSLSPLMSLNDEQVGMVALARFTFCFPFFFFFSIVSKKA
jgi:hypothetical protein